MNKNEIINNAITYILKHIEEELTIEQVAEHCHFSKYYFSRIFKEETGESVYAFIKRIKMEQSAFRLKVEPGRSVTDIGFDYGYCPSNYSQAFRKRYAQSPVEFRGNICEKSTTHPFFTDTEVKLESLEECDRKVTVKNIEDFRVIYERKIGNYRNLGEDWEQFIEKYKNYMDSNTILLERTFNDPSITEADKCLYDLCMTIPKDCTIENTYTIQGGKFATYYFRGFPEQIYNAFQNMFLVWLPGKNKKVDKRYSFEIYHCIDCDTMYMELEICIPII